MKRIQLISKKTLALVLLLGAASSATARWTQRTGISTFGPGRWGAMSFVIDNKIYAGGGYISNFSNANDWQKYDPVTRQWSFLANMPGTNMNRTEGVAFSINGKGYLGLGAQDYNGFNPAPTYLKDLWEYNAAADAWTKKADFPDSGRSDASYFTIAGKAYVVGGKTGSFAISADTWEYDPATNQWKEKAPFPGTHERGTGFSVNGKGYIVGGSMNGAATNKVYEFNPTANTWTEKAPYPETEITGALAFVTGNKAFVGLGGVEPFSATAARYPQFFWSYDAAGNKWSYAGGFELTPSGRMYGIAEVADGKVFIGAGWRLDNGSTQTFFFDFHETDPVAVAGVSSMANNALNIYPNPATDYLHVEPPYNNMDYTITDLSGRIIKSGTVAGNRIDINDMTPGIYTLTISTADDKFSGTIVKQ